MDLQGIPTLTLDQARELYAEKKLRGFYKMSDADYRLAPGINQSALKAMLKCPAAYDAAIKFKRSERKKHFDLGTLIHLLILEGRHAFDQVAARAPEGNPRTKVYREAKAEIEATGRIVVSDEDFEMIEDIYKSFGECEFARKVLSHGVAEVACFGAHPYTGFLMKGKIDYVNGQNLVDLKTTISASSLNFPKSARKNSYDFQAAFYIMVANCAIGENYFKNFAWVAVEKTPPYLWNFFTINQFDLMKSAADINNCFARLAKCSEEGKWPGFSPKFKTIDFSMWRT